MWLLNVNWWSDVHPGAITDFPKAVLLVDKNLRKSLKVHQWSRAKLFIRLSVGLYYDSKSWNLGTVSVFYHDLRGFLGVLQNLSVR